MSNQRTPLTSEDAVEFMWADMVSDYQAMVDMAERLMRKQPPTDTDAHMIFRCVAVATAEALLRSMHGSPRSPSGTKPPRGKTHG